MTSACAAKLFVTLVFAAAVCACGVSSRPHASHPAATNAATAKPASRHVSVKPVAGPVEAASGIGVAGTFQIEQRQITFIEPAHAGVAGQALGERTLLTTVIYPLIRRSAAGSASARFPLLLFAPGFMQCGGPYSDLLDSWARAGYVVAAVDFPRTDCLVGAAADEADLVNQPADMSYVLGRLLALSARPGNEFSGLLNPRQVAAVGQSDGGDTVAALAASTCCTDHRLAAVAVLSGAEWPPMPGRYFPGAAPPVLFAQGTADTVNPPWTSVQLYRADRSRARYYLDLFGADHTTPYWGSNPMERLVSRVTLDFFDRYVLGQLAAQAAMTHAGNAAHMAELSAG